MLPPIRFLSSSIRHVLKNEAIATLYPSVQYVDATNVLQPPTPVHSILSSFDRSKYDLHIVNPNANPPITKIVDRSVFLAQQRSHASNISRQKRQSTARLQGKEITLGTSISEHDFTTKMNKAQDLLERDYRVKFVIEPKGISSKQHGSKEGIQTKIINHLTSKISFEVVEQAQLLANKLSFALLKKSLK
jgi:translation initiation factor IF-3